MLQRSVFVVMLATIPHSPVVLTMLITTLQKKRLFIDTQNIFYRAPPCGGWL